MTRGEAAEYYTQHAEYQMANQPEPMNPKMQAIIALLIKGAFMAGYDVAMTKIEDKKENERPGNKRLIPEAQDFSVP